MPGTTAHYPSACREQPSGQVHAGAAPLLPPHRAKLCALQRSVPDGSPGQPAARGSAGALLLFTHSLLRLRRRHRDCSLHAPQYTADELGPGPSPKSRPVGPAAGHAGIWSPPPTGLYESPSGGELSAPQPSAWFVQAGGAAFWEGWTLPLSLPELRVAFFVFLFLTTSRLLPSASPRPRAGARGMRTSRVEVAGGGAVRANTSLGRWGGNALGTEKTTEPRSSSAIFVAAGRQHARKVSRHNWLFPILHARSRWIAIGYLI